MKSESLRKDAGNKILPLEDVRLELHFPHILETTYVDCWGNPHPVARISPMPYRSRELQFAALLKNAPEMFHILLELERTYFPLDRKGGALFNRFDEIVDEISNIYPNSENDITEKTDKESEK